jgi:uncharacterized protein (TIGR03083 family)
VHELDVIRRESDLFYATAEPADPALPVPSCPDWTIADLAWHLGEVHWFWASDIELRATNPNDVEQAKPPRPGEYGGLLRWCRAQATRMIEILEATPDDVEVWTWALGEADHTVRFIRRHQVQEAAVHRWDMQNAANPGQADPIAAEVASDSIDEFLHITVPWAVRADKPLTGSAHIHCTDTEGEWLLHPDGQVERLHAKGDVAIRGAASDILLALYTRVPIDQVELIGDAAIANEIVARANTD